MLLCLLAAITLAVVWLTWDQQPEGDPVLPAEEQEQTTQPSEETPQEQPSDQQQTEEQTGEQTEEKSQYEQLAQQFAQEKQEYYLLLAIPTTRCLRTGRWRLRKCRTAMRWMPASLRPCGR